MKHCLPTLLPVYHTIDTTETTCFPLQVMPTVVFFSAFISVMYHLGVMMLVVEKVAWVMQVTMGTTGGESLTAAANIFVGQVRHRRSTSVCNVKM